MGEGSKKNGRVPGLISGGLSHILKIFRLFSLVTVYFFLYILFFLRGMGTKIIYAQGLFLVLFSEVNPGVVWEIIYGARDRTG